MAMERAVFRMGISIRNSIHHPNAIRGCNLIRCYNTEATETKFRHISFTKTDLKSEESLKSLFERWQSHYNIGKNWGENEKTRRFNEFKKMAGFVHDQNKQGHSYTLALNEFAATPLD